MADKNYYDILGVSKTASDDEIKKAYRSLAKNITQTLIQEMPKPLKNSKKLTKHFRFFLTKQKNKTMTNTETKMVRKVLEVSVQVDLADLTQATLVALVTFLAISLVAVDLVAEGHQEEQIWQPKVLIFK